MTKPFGLALGSVSGVGPTPEQIAHAERVIQHMRQAHINKIKKQMNKRKVNK
jgi:hypothetical protein